MDITNKLHPGPRLLIPIQVEAMMIDDKVLSIMGGQWARNKAEYNNVISKLGAAFPREMAIARSIKKFPTAKAPEKGVHLQWVLPKGLRKGKLNSEGDLKFPLVPNRWLVMRTWHDEQGMLQLKGWVIQSDHIRKPTRTYNGPSTLIKEGDNIKHYQIGNVIPLEEWNGETDYDRTPLSAVSSQDFTFSSYTVNNENVFSYHDNLKDLGKPDDSISIGYVVTGWYGTPNEDPLYQETLDVDILLEKMKSLRFDIGEEVGLTKATETFTQWCEKTNTTLTPLMLCHGSIHSLEFPWKTSYKDGRPQRSMLNSESNPDIIVGNNSFDAMVTFISEKLKDSNLSQEQADFATDLLYAFDQKLLNDYIQPNGEYMLENKIHQSWFEGSTAGSYWEIVQNNQGDNEQEKQELKFQYENAMPYLMAINHIQKELDKNEELRATKLKQLYTSLYASKNQKRSKTRSKQWLEKAQEVDEQIKDLDEEIKSLKVLVQQQKQDIHKILFISDEENASNNFKLRPISEPPFWEPNDPVILVHAAKTSPKYTSKTNPICRYSGQFLDKIKLRNSSKVFSPTIPDFPNQEHLPKEMAALLKEYVLLNPNFTSFYFSNKKEIETIQKQQTLIWNSERLEGLHVETLLQEAGFLGVNGLTPVCPDFRSFRTFVLPWSPLFMDWVVYFFPSQGIESIAESKAEDSLKKWELEEDRLDFSWKSHSAVPKIDKKVKAKSWTIQGRNLLTSNIPQVLISQLENFKAELIDEKKQETIETIISMLNGFDIITQRLNGFNDYLQRYDTANQVPPELLKPKDNSIDVSALKNNRFGLPLGRIVRHNSVPINQYYPIRSGHLLVHFTRIVDDFGIGFYPVGFDTPWSDSNVLIPQDTHVIPKGRGLNHDKIRGTGLVQLTPRITQPARIQMEWMDADTDEPISQAQKNSPVCGWIVPNHLDKSLMIFDANGKL